MNLKIVFWFIKPLTAFCLKNLWSLFSTIHWSVRRTRLRKKTPQLMSFTCGHQLINRARQMKKRLQSAWAVSVEWVHFLFGLFSVTMERREREQEWEKGRQLHGHTGPRAIFHGSKGLLFIPIMKKRYQRYGKQFCSADRSTYDTNRIPASKAEIRQISKCWNVILAASGAAASPLPC